MSTSTSHTEKHTVVLHKALTRKAKQGVIENNVQAMPEAFYSRSANTAGWAVTVDSWDCVEAPAEMDANNLYRVFVTIDYSHKTRLPEAAEFGSILRRISTKAAQAAQGRFTLAIVDGEAYAPREVESEDAEEAAEMGYAPVAMPDDFDSYFSHLYGLQPQINMLRSALELGMLSNWNQRANTVLYGPPACGKTDVALSLKAALGDEAVWSLDGGAMTEAGITKELSEREILPRVIIIEEAEKANPDALRVLLGMFDQRGEVRKVTARASIQRETKVFGICTVNDKAKFDAMLAGAVSSRFSNPVRFSRPSREVLEQILSREIIKIGGDLAWIKPALDFCEETNISDPRRAVTICLCGRERLLTGEYQADLQVTMPLTEEAA